MGIMVYSLTWVMQDAYIINRSEVCMGNTGLLEHYPTLRQQGFRGSDLPPSSFQAHRLCQIFNAPLESKPCAQSFSTSWGYYGCSSLITHSLALVFLIMIIAPKP